VRAAASVSAPFALLLLIPSASGSCQLRRVLPKLNGTGCNCPLSVNSLNDASRRSLGTKPRACVSWSLMGLKLLHVSCGSNARGAIPGRCRALVCRASFFVL
jgi:hypothetical protein